MTRRRNALSDEAVEEAVADYGGKIMTSSARNLYLAGKVGRITRRTLWALAEQLRRGEFDPVGFEVSFSAAGQSERTEDSPVGG